MHRQAYEDGKYNILLKDYFLFFYIIKNYIPVYMYVWGLINLSQIITLQSLLQVCERIPTIATQLKILSTVKATMLGAQGKFTL